MNINNQVGSAIIPVLMAIGASISLGYYFMSQNETTGRLHSKSLALESVDSVSYIIKTALASSAICTKNFENRNTGYGPTVLKDTNDVIIAAAGQVYDKFGGIRLLSMRINPYKDPVSGQVNDYLYVVYDIDPQKRKKVSGSSTVAKKFRLKGRKNPNYEFCYHEESNFVEQSAKKNCEDMKGSWNNWKCTLDMNHFVDSSGVQCPPGKMQFVVVNDKLKTNCE